EVTELLCTFGPENPLDQSLISVDWCVPLEELPNCTDEQIVSMLRDMEVRLTIWQEAITVERTEEGLLWKERIRQRLLHDTPEKALELWRGFQTNFEIVDDDPIPKSKVQRELQSPEYLKQLFDYIDENIPPPTIEVIGPVRVPLGLKADNYILQFRTEQLLEKLSGEGRLYRPDNLAEACKRDDYWEDDPENFDRPLVRWPLTDRNENQIRDLYRKAWLWEAAKETITDPDELEKRRVGIAKCIYEDIDEEKVEEILEQRGKCRPETYFFNLKNAKKGLALRLKMACGPKGYIRPDDPPEQIQKLLPPEDLSGLSEKEVQTFLVDLALRNTLWAAVLRDAPQEFLAEYKEKMRMQIQKLERRNLPFYVWLMNGTCVDRALFEQVTGIKPFFPEDMEYLEVPKHLQRVRRNDQTAITEETRDLKAELRQQEKTEGTMKSSQEEVSLSSSSLPPSFPFEPKLKRGEEFELRGQGLILVYSDNGRYYVRWRNDTPKIETELKDSEVWFEVPPEEVVAEGTEGLRTKLGGLYDQLGAKVDINLNLSGAFFKFMAREYEVYKLQKVILQGKNRKIHLAQHALIDEVEVSKCGVTFKGKDAEFRNSTIAFSEVSLDLTNVVFKGCQVEASSISGLVAKPTFDFACVVHKSKIVYLGVSSAEIKGGDLQNHWDNVKSVARNQLKAFKTPSQKRLDDQGF
ncbi:MAG: hypothetical protein GX589_01415, partial [Deltaproteobacteria bacterium]|nr:hypothetical protein [Deltaproteobacteria bacterium]